MSVEAQLPRTFTVEDDGRYVLAVASVGISFTVDRLRRERHDLHGELSVTCPLPGAQTVDGTLSVGTFNLSSPTTRRTTAKLLAERSFADDLPWGLWLEELCQRTLVAERAGTPAIDLRDVVLTADEDDWRIVGFALPRRHPAIVFADGGSLKSYLELFILGLLARAGLRVALFDWELGPEDHRRRLAQLFGDDLPEVRYVRCERALVHEVDRLRRIAREERLDYAGFDSVAFACDGPPEAAEAAATYFRAVRQIGIGSLHIAHVSKAEDGDKKPFGSAFWFNGARACWYLKRTEGSPDRPDVDLAIFPRKANLGPLGAAFALRATFADGRLRFAKVDVATLGDDVSAKLPIWQRMLSATRHQGPLTYAELAEQLSENVASVERAARRGFDKTFTRVTGPDGVFRVAALDRGAA